MSLFLLSIYTDYQHRVLSHFYQTPDNEKLLHASNQIPHPEQEHLSRSKFLVNLAARNKEFPHVKSAP